MSKTRTSFQTVISTIAEWDDATSCDLRLGDASELASMILLRLCQNHSPIFNDIIEIEDMINNCPDVPRDPTSLPMTVLAMLRALRGRYSQEFMSPQDYALDQGEILVERLSEFEQRIDDDATFTDWNGHVSPAMHRFKNALVACEPGHPSGAEADR